MPSGAGVSTSLRVTLTVGVGVIPRGRTRVGVIDNTGSPLRTGAGCVRSGVGLCDADVALPLAQAAVKHRLKDITIRDLLRDHFIGD